MKIYLSSSPGNGAHQVLAAALCRQGHQVYDSCSLEHDCEDPLYHARDKPMLPSRDYLDSQISYQTASLVIGHMEAMECSDLCILLLPSSSSSHVCAGYMKGLGKKVLVYSADSSIRPELMYLVFDRWYDSMDDLLRDICSEKFDQGRSIPA